MVRCGGGALLRSGCGQCEPCDADGAAECLRGVAGQAEAETREETARWCPW
jgi:hypothetical protein